MLCLSSSSWDGYSKQLSCNCSLSMCSCGSNTIRSSHPSPNNLKSQNPIFQFPTTNATSIPFIAFLLPIDVCMQYPLTLPRTTSPSPNASKRSSPIPFATPRISTWINKLTKGSVSTQSLKKANTTQWTTNTTKLESPLELDSSNIIEEQSNSVTIKSSIKRVASQPAGSFGRQSHKHVPIKTLSFAPQNLIENIQNHHHSSTQLDATLDHLHSPFAQSTQSHSQILDIHNLSSNPLSIIRCPSLNVHGNDDSNDLNHKLLTTTASSYNKGSCLLSCSPSDISFQASGPLTAPPATNSVPFYGGKQSANSPNKSSGSLTRKGSSDPDLSVTPKCNSLSSGNGSAGNKSNFKFMISPESLHLLV